MYIPMRQIMSIVVFDEQQAHTEWMIKYLDFVTFSMCHEVHMLYYVGILLNYLRIY